MRGWGLYTPVIQALRRQREEAFHKLEASLVFIVNSTHREALSQRNKET